MEVNTLSQGLLPRTGSGGSTATRDENWSCQWLLMLVPLKGGIGSIWGPPEGKDYKWYISGIFPANWGMDYMPPIPPFRGTRNNH